MTRTELERIAALEEKVDSLKESVDRIHVDLCQSIERADKRWAEFLEAADSRYASKVVERLVYGMVGTVLLAALYAMLHLIGL